MRRENDSFDKAFDMLLTEAAIMANKDIGEKIKEPEEEIVFSKEHEEKMQRIFRRERRKRILKNASQLSKRCACVLLAAAAITSAGVLSVDAWRSRALNFIFEPEKPNSEYSFDESQGTSYADDRISIGYVPKGFVPTVYSDKDSPGWLVSFENGDLYFEVDMESLDVSGGIDTEDAVVEELTIHGHKAIYSSNERVNILLWSDDYNAYTIMGNIDKIEILKIGESVNY